jgi:hypothetical protein
VAIAGGVGGLSVGTPVTITHANILTLPTTPVAVVSAPVAGSMLIPLGAILVADCSAGDYTNIDAAAFLKVADAALAVEVLTILDEATNGGVSALLAPGGAPSFASLIPWPGTPYGAAPTGETEVFDPTAIDGVALAIQADNGASGDFTGGDALNTLTVTVVYVNVATP